jgi:hypothetical protein
MGHSFLSSSNTQNQFVELPTSKDALPANDDASQGHYTIGVSGQGSCVQLGRANFGPS